MKAPPRLHPDEVMTDQVNPYSARLKQALSGVAAKVVTAKVTTAKVATAKVGAAVVPPLEEEAMKPLVSIN